MLTSLFPTPPQWVWPHPIGGHFRARPGHSPVPGAVSGSGAAEGNGVGLVERPRRPRRRAPRAPPTAAHHAPVEHQPTGPATGAHSVGRSPAETSRVGGTAETTWPQVGWEVGEEVEGAVEGAAGAAAGAAPEAWATGKSDERARTWRGWPRGGACSASSATQLRQCPLPGTPPSCCREGKIFPRPPSLVQRHEWMNYPWVEHTWRPGDVGE